MIHIQKRSALLLEKNESYRLDYMLTNSESSGPAIASAAALKEKSHWVYIYSFLSLFLFHLLCLYFNFDK